IERLRSLPVLMLITFRPEFESPWSGLTNATSVVLDRLAQEDTEILIEQVAAGRILPTGLRDEIVAKTDGIPLFIEELTETVLTSGLLANQSDTPLLPSFAVPSTLQDSLMARLDRLGTAKTLAQIAAVIGRETSLDLLESASEVPSAEFRG